MKKILLMVFISSVAFMMFACFPEAKTPTSASGVSKTTVRLKTGSDGLTIEQRNVKERLKIDNKVGAIKHLYVISPYSGQVIIYSTVKGKITSSGKRLMPYKVDPSNECNSSIPIKLDGRNYRTSEVLQDDGTYGHSSEYIFWWDAKEIYHQHFFTGGQIIHLSDQPIPVKNIVINMELTKD